MSNEEAELLARTTYRRMSRSKRRTTLQSSKVLIIWLVAITANIAIVRAAVINLWDRPIVCGFIIVIVSWSFISQIDELTQNILKKSPRNSHSRRDKQK